MADPPSSTKPISPYLSAFLEGMAKASPLLDWLGQAYNLTPQYRQRPMVVIDQHIPVSVGYGATVLLQGVQIGMAVYRRSDGIHRVEFYHPDIAPHVIKTIYTGPDPLELVRHVEQDAKNGHFDIRALLRGAMGGRGRR